MFCLFVTVLYDVRARERPFDLDSTRAGVTKYYSLIRAHKFIGSQRNRVAVKDLGANLHTNMLDCHTSPYILAAWSA